MSLKAIFLLSSLAPLSAHRQNFGPNLTPQHHIFSEPIDDAHTATHVFGVPKRDLEVTSQYTTDHNGVCSTFPMVTHIHYRQLHNGIPITNAVANVNLDSQGQVVSMGHTLYLDPVVMLNQGETSGQLVYDKSGIELEDEIYVTPAQAAAAFARHLDLLMEADMTQTPEMLLDVRTTVFNVTGFPKAENDVPVKLMYIKMEDNTLSLVWDIVVDLSDNWYNAHVCAKTKQVLGAIDWVADAGFRVYPLGINDPFCGDRKLLMDPHHPIASPAGWNRLGSVENGTLKNVTIGNNVFAQENADGGYQWMHNYRPTGDDNLVFDFSLNLTDTPSSYLDAAIVNLFYINNMIHDLFYLYGFDEKAGNFQEFNFGRGGRQGDGVIANAQDGSGYNNANFATPPDGQRPRMRMYVWNAYKPMRDGDLESGIVIHEYSHGLSIRLTGGPMNVNCLGYGESGGMGEGWGDAIATFLRMTANDTKQSVFTMGEYAAGRNIRRYAYSTSLGENPSTYGFIKRPEYWEVHAKGEVWAEILYQVYWAVVEEHGYTPLWFGHPKPKGKKKKKPSDHFGNRMLLQNIIDGLKLQPCYPTFVDARDAILLADRLNYNGISTCAMWKAFASRGMGAHAVSGGREDFTLPVECETA